MSEYPAGAWQRLARLLKSRRVHISTDYRARTTFCDATGLNYKLVYDIEGAPKTRTNFTDEYFALLEAGYELAEGAIRRALAGGPLEPRPDTTTPPTLDSQPNPAPAEEIIEEAHAPPHDDVTRHFQGLLASVDQRLAEMTEKLAEQSRQIEELRRERQQDTSDEHRKGA